MTNLSPVKIWRHQKAITRYLSQGGKIISWTIVRTPPEGFEKEAPYPVVLVELAKGERKIGQLVDWQAEDLRAGQKVKAVYRRLRQPEPEGIIPYGIKFKPI